MLRLVSEVCHRYRLIADYFQMLCNNTGVVLAASSHGKGGAEQQQKTGCDEGDS